MTRFTSLVPLLLLVLLAGSSLAAQPPARTLAVTLDDLPYATVPGEIEAARRATEALLSALARHRAPAVGFVNEVQLQVPGERDARFALLQRWDQAGVVLGNHTFSHPRLQDTPPGQFEDDIVRGDVALRQLRGPSNGQPLFFRYPFNSTGPTREVKERIQSFLQARGYRIAPFTVDSSDYLFDRIWIRARKEGDTALASRTREAYLAHVEAVLGFAEGLSRDTFQREIPQILLLHANDLNADSLDALLTRLAARGYRFVSLEQALADPAYSTPDLYVGPWGISWLHRWSAALGLPIRLREEPDPPQWALDLYGR
ncbi:MAG TPA: polysaccharide deacetylase family protein [Thermoanaerobaculia bacterium]|nr:polysaccharide deacetylase family protein [Thermoanaerobaculia bacterium]